MRPYCSFSAAPRDSRGARYNRGMTNTNLAIAGATGWGVGAVAAGNFSVTAAMMLAGAELAARHLPRWEIVDYAVSTKPDAPSGTARELAERLAEIGEPPVDVPVDQVAGHPEARGATVA